MKIYLSEEYEAGRHFFRIESGDGMYCTTVMNWKDVVDFLDEIVFDYELVAVA